MKVYLILLSLFLFFVSTGASGEDPLDALAWSDDSPTTALRRGPFVYLNRFVGEPNGVSYSYATTTSYKCSISSDGELWGLELGTCKITVTASLAGHQDKIMTRNITVTRGNIATTSYSSCAILADGQIKCWGSGRNGALGPNQRDNVGDGSNEMGIHLPSVDLKLDSYAKTLVGSSNATRGYGHFCARLDNGKVVCWGNNTSGQLGTGDGDTGVDVGTGVAVKALSLGSRFSCALLDNDKMKCWGESGYGQLGLGSKDDRGDDPGEMGDNLGFVNLGLGRTAKDIEAGTDHVCALLDNNKVKCWGYNRNGELGQGHRSHIGDDPNEMSRLDFVDLGTNRTAKRVSAGQGHTCAILDNNDLACWGWNRFYKLGIDNSRLRIGDGSNEMGDDLSPTHLVTRDASYVTLGRHSTCVIKKNGKTYCWGYNGYGMLGLGDRSSKGSSTTQADDLAVDLGTDRSARIVQLGSQHSCALLDNDEIKCWGRNNAGQLGQGNTLTRGDGPNEMGDDLTAVVLVPDIAGLVWDGYSSNRITYGDQAPVLSAPRGYPATAVFSYSTTTPDVCTVVAWMGTLNILDAGICRIMLTVRASGYRDEVRTFDLTVNGSDMSNLAWTGYSLSSVTYGESTPTLNTPTGAPAGAVFSYSTTTTDVCTVDSSTGVLTIVGIGTCSVILTADAVGYNDTSIETTVMVYQKSINFAWSDDSPTTALRRGPFVYLNRFVGAPTGVRYRYSTMTPDNCSISSNGELWGLEIGTCRISVTARVTGYSDKTITRDITITRGHIATTGYSSCALLSDGQVKCWGEGKSGVLGRGDTRRIGDSGREMGVHLASVNLGKGLKVKSLAGSGNSNSETFGHFCALFENNKIKCWGNNISGQLGKGHRNSIGDHSGEMGDRLGYVDLGGGHAVKALALGYRFSCAILDNNKVKCWGLSRYGQLGLNDRVNKGDYPGEMGDQLGFVDLGQGRRALDIEAGTDHVCTLLDNKKVWCWGRNQSGQLGQGHSYNMGDDWNEMSRLRTVNLGRDRTAKRISAGYDHTCAILDNNNLACWGANRFNKLGIGNSGVKIGDDPYEMGNRLSPTHLVSQDAAYVSLGGHSTCIIKKNGVTYCWGNNAYGTLGLGHRSSRGSSNTQPGDIDVDLGSNRKAKVVESGYLHTCALLDNDDIKCWGRNSSGQLGQGHTQRLGDGWGEMGDNLAAVDLLFDMVDLAWTGYSSDSMTFNGTVPSLNAPTGAPSGAAFAYLATTPEVCSVDSDGALTILDHGTCTVKLTASASGYRDGSKTSHVTVNGLDMNTLAWRGYSSNSITYKESAPSLASPTGAPVGATFSYATTTTNVCTVNRTTGALTIVGSGACTVTLTAHVAGYNNGVKNATVTVNPATMSLTWTGYSSNSITFGDSLTLNTPSSTPSNATFRYTSRTTNICTVANSSGAVTQVDDGTCTIRLTASVDHYSDAIKDYDITIKPKAMGTLSWSGYSNSNTTTFPSAPSLASSPSGAPSGAVWAYTTNNLRCLQSRSFYRCFKSSG